MAYRRFLTPRWWSVDVKYTIERIMNPSKGMVSPSGLVSARVSATNTYPGWDAFRSLSGAIS